MPLFFSTEVSPGHSPRRRSLASVPGSEKSGLVESPNVSPFKVSVSEASVTLSLSGSPTPEGATLQEVRGVTGSQGHRSAGPDGGTTVKRKS